MKVILKSKIKKLGNIGDIVEVKDGYAKNMLIPNGLALFYTDKNYEAFKIKKAEIEKENQENKAKAEELKDKILAKEIILIENAGDDGKLYGSITGMKLANVINSLLKLDNAVKKSNVSLKEAIKNIGKYEIVLSLHPEVSFDKIVIVARSKEEANKIKKGELEIKKDNNKSQDALLESLTTETKEEEPKKAKKAKKAKDEEKVEEKEENKAE